MQVKDFFWRYFQTTGCISAYLIYKELVDGDEILPPLAVPEEDR
ncbi:MAG: YqzL-like protein [Clostridia bacterium]|nr:YqzL-like protein [Clostridia bacterium]